MADLILARASSELKEAVGDYRREYFDYGESHINGSCGLFRYDDFDEWLKVVLSNTNATTFFSVRKADNRIIGSIQLRHGLTPELETHGGHIGYGVRPSERRKGYGKQQLRLVLDIAKEMGIPKVLITCDKDNSASGKTAASCGGVLSHEAVYEGKMQQYYWIDLEQKMKFYIASKLENFAQVRSLAKLLTAIGWEHTYDWTAHGSVKETDEETLKAIGQQELDGVRNADVVIVLTPQGRGTHVELGIAAALGKAIFLHHVDDTYFKCDDNTSTFYWLPNVRRVTGSVEGLVEELKKTYPTA